MVDRTPTGEVADHDSLQHQVELQLEAHPEVLDEDDLLLMEYCEIKRLEGQMDIIKSLIHLSVGDSHD